MFCGVTVAEVGYRMNILHIELWFFKEPLPTEHFINYIFLHRIKKKN